MEKISYFVLMKFLGWPKKKLYLIPSLRFRRTQIKKNKKKKRKNFNSIY